MAQGHGMLKLIEQDGRLGNGLLTRLKIIWEFELVIRLRLRRGKDLWSEELFTARRCWKSEVTEEK